MTRLYPIPYLGCCGHSKLDLPDETVGVFQRDDWAIFSRCLFRPSKVSGYHTVIRVSDLPDGALTQHRGQLCVQNNLASIVLVPHVRGAITLPYVRGEIALPCVRGAITLPYVRGEKALPYVRGAIALPCVR